MDVHLQELANEPLLMAAAAMPLLLRALCCIKLPPRAPPRPTQPRPTPTRTPAAAGKHTSQTGKHTDTARGSEPPSLLPARMSRRTILRRVLTVLALLLCVGVAAVLAVWKGLVVVCASIVLLFTAARGMTRPWATFDLVLAVAACSGLCLLTAVKGPHNTSVLVSQDPTINSYATIAEGLAAVAEGGTVRVLPGTYREAVQLSKAVTLEGIGQSNRDVTIQSPRVSTPTLCVTSDSLLRNMRVLPPDDTERPTVYIGDSFLGSRMEDVELGCAQAPAHCAFIVGGHPFLKHSMTNVTLLPAKPRVLPPTGNDSEAADHETAPATEYYTDAARTTHVRAAIFEEEKTVLFANGTTRAGQPLSMETEMLLIRMTEHHVVSVVMLLKWVDVSAHWVTVAYRHFREQILPVLLVWAEAANVAATAWLRIARSFACAAGNVPSLCPAPHPHHDTAFAIGETVYNVIGVVFVYVLHYVAVVAGYAGDAAGWALHYAVIPALSWMLQTIPNLLYVCVAAYLNTSQYMQLGHHVLFFILNVWMSFDSKIPFDDRVSAVVGSGWLIAPAMRLSKNLPLVVLLGTEYLVGITLVLGSWFVLPIVLPFVSAYAIMAVTHIVLPMQSAYTLLKRHAGGQYQRSMVGYAAVFIVRAVLQIAPVMVYVLCISAFYSLKALVDSKKPTEAAEVAAPPAPSRWGFDVSYYSGFLASFGRSQTAGGDAAAAGKVVDTTAGEAAEGGADGGAGGPRTPPHTTATAAATATKATVPDDDAATNGAEGDSRSSASHSTSDTEKRTSPTAAAAAGAEQDEDQHNARTSPDDGGALDPAGHDEDAPPPPSPDASR